MKEHILARQFVNKFLAALAFMEAEGQDAMPRVALSGDTVCLEGNTMRIQILIVTPTVEPPVHTPYMATPYPGKVKVSEENQEVGI